jgi:NDP-sugar pyrophosphorylase family protein
MKIVIPMAGTGNRFVEKGYADPKPLIKVNGKRIIEYILDMFDRKKDEFVFICNDVHLNTTDMEKILKELVPNAKIVAMPQHKLGPVYTVKTVYDLIEDNEEVIISYCDNPHLWDRKDFENAMNKGKFDGCVLTHTGFHPHTLAHTKMAFVKGDNGVLEEIKEKACYTDNPLNEHASTGVYYFNKGSYIKKYFEQAMKENLQYNGEYYVTLVYNLLVKDGLKIGYYDTPFVTVFGTPEEVENFESWAKILKGKQASQPLHAAACFEYWSEYHKLTS